MLHPFARSNRHHQCMTWAEEDASSGTRGRIIETCIIELRRQNKRRVDESDKSLSTQDGGLKNTGLVRPVWVGWPYDGDHRQAVGSSCNECFDTDIVFVAEAKLERLSPVYFVEGHDRCDVFDSHIFPLGGRIDFCEDQHHKVVSPARPRVSEGLRRTHLK